MMLTCTREFLTLKFVVDQIQSGNMQHAQTLLHTLCEQEAMRSRSDSDRLLYLLFLKGFSRRLNQQNIPIPNIYLADHDIPQIDLFSLLVSRFPLVSISRKIANQMLASQVERGDDTIALLSLGMGSGLQEADFLRLLTQRDFHPESWS